MAQYCHASHEVYHEGVAQRAHNLSPVPFGAAKSDERSSYHCCVIKASTYNFATLRSDRRIKRMERSALFKYLQNGSLQIYSPSASHQKPTSTFEQSCSAMHRSITLDTIAH